MLGEFLSLIPSLVLGPGQLNEAIPHCEDRAHFKAILQHDAKHAFMAEARL